MTADKTPIDEAVEQALDAFVYAPIGLLFDGPARFPTLVRNGRAQVTNALIMGQFAVRMGRTEVQKRTADLDGPVLDVLRGLGIVSPPPAPAPTPTPADVGASAPGPDDDAAARRAEKATGNANGSVTRTRTDARANEEVAEQAAAERSAATDAATPSADVLPIADYDSLSASQVVSRLRGLAPGQLEAIRAYESATRGRKTILNRVQQLTKS